MVSCGRALAFFTVCKSSSSSFLTRRSFVLASPTRGLLLPSLLTSTFLSNPVRAQDSSRTCQSMTTDATSTTGYLNAKDAASLDAELMSSPGFTLEQLMELAGLSVAQAIYHLQKPPASVLVVCGPGNNGGDGLVAARHLVLFGYPNVRVVYPKQSSKQPHYANLVQQCHDVGIPVDTEMPTTIDDYDIVVDAIFGFSFQGTPREPFQSILQQLGAVQHKVVSVDVPSGWNVNEGDVENTQFNPFALVSLTTPKLCAKTYQGRHFCGGRFLPPALAQKYKVQMPPYPDVSQVMELPKPNVCE